MSLPPQSMRPQLWRLFLEVAEHGSLTRVAELRDMAQPQLSRQLADIEAQCGGALFRRHGRGLVLTPLGEWAVPRVQAWLQQTDQLASDLRQGADLPFGKVRLAAIPSTLEKLVCPVILQVHERYPTIQLEVIEALDSQMDEGLSGGLFDLAIRYLQAASVRREDRVLQHVATYLVGRQGDALLRRKQISFEKLKDLPLVLPRRPSVWRDLLDRMADKQGFELRVVLEADSLTLQKQMVLQGHGYTLLGPMALEPGARTGDLRAARLINPEIPRVVALTAQHVRPATQAQQVVADLVAAQAARFPRQFFDPLQGASDKLSRA
jgi:LysR family nitrogen assimilation transcriptional regulator